VRTTIARTASKGAWGDANKVAIIAIFCACAAAQRPPDIGKIVQESARVTDADRKANPNYDYSETDLESDGSSRTYAVHMLLGSPYQELTAVNGKALPPQKQEEEQQKLNQEISRRRRESPEERAHRVQKFQKEQNRDRRFMEEFVHAFDFKLLGEQSLDNHQVYVVQATPRAGYRPANREAEVLTGMRGRLWIDKKTYQWVKVEAEVIRPVSIAGFVATVEPGTRFELEKSPVEGDIWLPKHYAMTSKAKILSIFHRKNHQDETYFNYHKAPQASGGGG
jgi:hypothetical protein